MSKKHFNAIASALRDSEPDDNRSPEYDTWRACVRSVTEAIEDFNPAFDRSRFLAACGYSQGEYDA